MAALTLYPGDVKTATPTVTGSDSANAGPSGYDLSFTNDAPAVVQVVVNPSSGTAQTATVTALSAGIAHVTWTAKSDGKYGGGPLTQADTITVNAGRTITGVTVAYS
jgi:hypothetical protein